MDIADGGQLIFTERAYKEIVHLFPSLEEQFEKHESIRVKRDFINVYQYLDKRAGSYINNDPPEEVKDYGFVTRSVLKAALEPIGLKLEQLATSSGCQFLEGSKDIYEVVAKTIRQAKENIKVVLLESRPEASKAVLEALSEAVNRGVRYDIVVVHNPNKPSAGFETNHQELMQNLKGVQGNEHVRYHPYVLETKKPICFDTIIMDGKAVGLGFTHTEGELELQHGIMLRDKDVADKFDKWFDNEVMNVVKNYGKTFNEWKREKDQKKSECGND